MSRRIEPVEKAVGTRHGVVQELIRLTQPEPLIRPRPGLRDEHILRKLDQVRVPSGPPSARLAPRMCEQHVPIGKPVIVEGGVTADRHDVVSGVALVRLDPYRLETRKGLQRRVGQDMAGGAGGKKTVPQPPPPPPRAPL